MNYKPNPLLYGANEDFLSSFKLVITMRSAIDYKALSQAVAAAMVRYPYFSVIPVQEGNSIVLRHNERPVAVFDDGRCPVLGSEACNGHLLAFGCEGKKIFLHCSHYIADGMGIDPLLKTVLYLYVSALYGSDGLSVERILMPQDPVGEEEYSYPFEKAPFEVYAEWLPKPTAGDVYALNANAFDGEGLYAYHLHIPQKAMMSKANPSDGSPVSFLSVMLYRALCELDESIEQPIVAHVQHQYRMALKTPYNRHSLVNYISATLPPRAKNWHIERQNTVVRGQIIIGSEPAADLNAVNRLVAVIPEGEDVTLAQKQQAMRHYIDQSIQGKTFGISYVGRMDWCGLDQYVEDLHAYIGEKHTPNMLLIEVMTVGADFTINFMQSGRGERYVNAFVEQLKKFDIPVSMVGEERYTLCDTKILG